MTRARQTQLLTISVLVLALAVAVGRNYLPRSRSAPASPQDAVYAMLDAARAGDIPKYLSSYTGAMRSALEQSVRETGEEGFRRYLRESNAAVKGVAVSDPRAMGGREATLRVEYVYQDRNEAQTVYLERDSSVWKIARVEGAERVKTLVPYGSPVQ